MRSAPAFILAGIRFQQEAIMWRVTVAVGLGIALAGAAPAVFAADPPASGQSPSHQHDAPAAAGADKHAEHMRQHMEMMRKMAGGGPTMPGQDAFGAVAEIVRILEADPATDWSKVALEALRQHLIDMNEVTLRADAAATEIDGGLAIAVTGSGRTLAAIQRMVAHHAAALNGLNGWSAKAEPLPDGVRLTVTASDPAEVRHIRGLG